MAGVAIRPRLDSVFGNQLGAKLLLIGRRLILHVEDLIPRANEVLRLAMAVDAPVHAQRVDLINQRHLIHASMTGGAADALMNVDAVIEEDEIGQVMDAIPTNRLPGLEALPDRLQHARVLPDLRMAAHACGGIRNPGEWRRLDRGMAEPAIQSVITGMVLMAKRDRLLARNADVRDVRTVIDPIRCQQNAPHSEHNNGDCDAGDTIRAFAEELGHASRCLIRSIQLCFEGIRESRGNFDRCRGFTARFGPSAGKQVRWRGTLPGDGQPRMFISQRSEITRSDERPSLTFLPLPEVNPRPDSSV